MMLLPLLLALHAPSFAAAPPREQLKALTADLAKTPADDALRGRVIALAKTLKPAPPVPEEARRAFIRGNTAFKDAKDAAGYGRAASRFEEASVAAPWWADPYFNRAKAEQAAGRYDDALRTLKHYLAAAASPSEKRQGQDLIYELEEKRDGQKADAAAASSAADAARTRAEASIEGTWWSLQDDGVSTWRDPNFTVTRKEGGFDLKFHDPNTLLQRFTATETTLNIVYKIYGDVTYELHREGDLLVGNSFINSDPQHNLLRARLIRKPLPAP
jgi:tetratricopeptide (TPR) repeat protein